MRLTRPGHVGRVQVRHYWLFRQMVTHAAGSMRGKLEAGRLQSLCPHDRSRDLRTWWGVVRLGAAPARIRLPFHPPLSLQQWSRCFHAPLQIVHLALHQNFITPSKSQVSICRAWGKGRSQEKPNRKWRPHWAAASRPKMHDWVNPLGDIILPLA